MRRRSRELPWKIGAAAVALIATAMALYVQLFESRAQEEEARRAAARLEEALAESRSRLKAEILSQLRAEAVQRAGAARQDTEPLPDAVLRLGPDGTVLGLVDPADPAGAVLRLDEKIGSLSKQMEESDRALRRELEELRGAVRRELDASRRTTGLILVALLPLVLHLLYALRGDRDRGEEESAAPEDRARVE